MDLSTLMPQQKEIVTTLDRPLFVSAGAGSGKTFTLTRRILWALSPESGPFIEHLDQVLAITFTNDAAAEIRERVRGALIQAGMADEALRVDDAWISTIHGMCSRILRAHALELGLDPGFTMLEQAAADELMDLAVEHVLERIKLRGAGGAEEEAPGKPPLPESLDALFSWYDLRGAGAFGRSASIKSILTELLRLSSSLAHGMDDVQLLRGYVDTATLADAYRPCLEASAKAKELGLRVLEAVDAFNAGPQGFDDVLRLMMACDAPRASKNFDKEMVALLKAEVAETVMNALVAAGGAAPQELLALARCVEAEYRALKAAQGALDNDDLLRLAHDALAQHENIRAEYAGRFKMVMIDEFQDTDRQQVELIGYLAGPGGRALCTVGDAQQSIYRFRGAEVEVFRTQEKKVSGAAAQAEAGGKLVKLVRNFRSHAEVLDYVAQVFDGERGGLMQNFLNLEPNAGRKDCLQAQELARKQAFLVAGGNMQERTLAKAAHIAKRFRAFADAGQPAGDMVLLLGGMTRADVYADAIRAQGLDCVIAGGSIFARLYEVQVVRALVRALANPADTQAGLFPVLASPLFALGAQEFLALSTRKDADTGETFRRNIDAGLFSDEDLPEFAGLPLLARAREVLRAAYSCVGREPFANVVRRVVNESGWFVRLASEGPEGKAKAANVLKALDAVARCEEQVGNAPRAVSAAFDAFLEGKEAPGALNEDQAGAVRIMTVHASKGLEFPVVAVSECYDARAASGAFVAHRTGAQAQAVALPAKFSGLRGADGGYIKPEELKKRFEKLYKGKTAWLNASYVDEVCGSGSVAETYLGICAEEGRLDLDERARLLYVAMTRAKEAVVLAMDAGVRSGKLVLNEETSLLPAVLQSILPGGSLGEGRLAFEGSQPGDFELVALADFTDTQTGEAFEANAAVEDFVPEDTALSASDHTPDHFVLVRPQQVDFSVQPATKPARDSYSYSSMAAALHAEAEDSRAGAGAALQADADEPAFNEVASEEPAAAEAEAAVSEKDDPTALGSAFHAAAQWLVETGAATVPQSRRDALARYWHVSPAQRKRLDEALDRWERSAVRKDLMAWPQVRAELPFFSLGLDDENVKAKFGIYAEGAIDALASDPADAGRALVIDYKTGGSLQETSEQLQEKHALQAKVYADVLHKAGYKQVTLKFVRVEIPTETGDPQVVEYQL